MPIPTWKVIILDFVSRRAITLIAFFGFTYTVLADYLLNYRLIYQILLQPFSFTFKIMFLFTLYTGIWSTLSQIDLVFFVVTTFLVGVNCYLFIKSLSILRQSDTLKISIGSSTFFGLITTGCTSCGLSLISILGLSSSVSLLPFHGIEIHIVAITFLFISFYYLIKKIFFTNSCTIRKKRTKK